MTSFVSSSTVELARGRSYDLTIVARKRVTLELDPEMALLLRERALNAGVTEGEIVEQALRAFELRSLVGRVHRRSDVDEDGVSGLVAEELRAVRAERL